MLFRTPETIIKAWVPKDVPKALAAVDEMLERGFYLAGYIAYEAGFALEPALSDLASTLPNKELLVWLGCYRNSELREEPFAEGCVSPLPSVPDLRYSLRQEEYEERVEVVRELIASGETYQANLTMDAVWQTDEEPAKLYERLLRAQPVHYDGTVAPGATALPGVPYQAGRLTYTQAFHPDTGNSYCAGTGSQCDDQYMIYDAAGNITTQGVWLPSGTTVAVAATYNLVGSVTSEIYPDGRVVQAGYDNYGRPSSIAYQNWNSVLMQQPYFTIPSTGGYDAAGHFLSGTFGNGVAYSASFDSRQRISSLTYGQTTAPLWSKQYSWTANSNLQSYTDQISGAQRQFQYDTVNRLHSAQDLQNNQPVLNGLNQVYTYDSFGNLNQNGSFNSTFNANNQMSYYSYDANGNLLSDGLWTYTWDFQNRLATAAGETYVYDAEDHRVEKQGQVAEDVVYLGDRPIARYGPAGWIDVIYGPTGIIAEVPGTEAGSPAYRVADHLSTSAGLLDASGSLTSPVDHTPYGNVVEGTDSDPYVFTGKERDAESGLDYFGARYYSSWMGRFSSPDPSGLAYADPTNPQSLNLYSYALNNPLRFIDPSGLTPCDYGSSDQGGEDYEDADNDKECTDHGGTPIDYSETVNVNANGSGDFSLSTVDGGSSTLIQSGQFVAPNKPCAVSSRVEQGIVGVANLTDAYYRAQGVAGGTAALAEAPPAAAAFAVYGTTSVFGQALAGGAQVFQAVTGSGGAKPVEQIGNILAGPASGLTTLVATGNAEKAETYANRESFFNGGVGLVNKATPLLIRLGEFALGAVGLGSVGCSSTP